MKKRTTYPDGRVDEIEGTAEEIATLDGKEPHACPPCHLPHFTLTGPPNFWPAVPQPTIRPLPLIVPPGTTIIWGENSKPIQFAGGGVS